MTDCNPCNMSLLQIRHEQSDIQGRMRRYVSALPNLVKNEADEAEAEAEAGVGCRGAAGSRAGRHTAAAEPSRRRAPMHRGTLRQKIENLGSDTCTHDTEAETVLNRKSISLRALCRRLAGTVATTRWAAAVASRAYIGNAHVRFRVSSVGLPHMPSTCAGAALGRKRRRCEISWVSPRNDVNSFFLGLGASAGVVGVAGAVGMQLLPGAGKGGHQGYRMGHLAATACTETERGLFVMGSKGSQICFFSARTLLLVASQSSCSCPVSSAAMRLCVSCDAALQWGASYNTRLWQESVGPRETGRKGTICPVTIPG